MAKRPPKVIDEQPDPANELEPSPAVLALTPERLRNATGTAKSSLQRRMLQQALDACWLEKGETFDEALVTTLAALEAIAPVNGMEGMLATQMVATHEAAMECLRRAMISGQHIEGRDVNLKHTAKLLQIYARQMEALDKHRNRGQQRITVEHVHVHAGGQAIVGDVQAPVAPRTAALVSPATQIEQSTATAAPTDLTAMGDGEPKRRVRKREK